MKYEHNWEEYGPILIRACAFVPQVFSKEDEPVIEDSEEYLSCALFIAHKRGIPLPQEMVDLCFWLAEHGEWVVTPCTKEEFLTIE